MSEVFEQFADLIAEFVEFMASPFVVLIELLRGEEHDDLIDNTL